LLAALTRDSRLSLASFQVVFLNTKETQMNTTETNITYSSLRDFLEGYVGNETPSKLGRMIYKAGLGAWTVFLREVKPSFEISEEFLISFENETLHVSTKFAHGNCSLELKQDMKRFLGFNESDTSKKEHTLDSYLTQLTNFSGNNPHYRISFFKVGQIIEVTVTNKVPANIEEIYYEDKQARTLDWIDDCVGIRIGSIVEGSEVEISPENLMFPFKEIDFEKVTSHINEQVSFYWERDNSDNFYIQYKEVCASVRVCNGEFNWCDNNELTDEIKQQVDDWLDSYYEVDMNTVNHEKVSISRELFIQYYTNDDIFY